jgi:hypothetical protein
MLYVKKFLFRWIILFVFFFLHLVALLFFYLSQQNKTKQIKLKHSFNKMFFITKSFFPSFFCEWRFYEILKQKQQKTQSFILNYKKFEWSEYLFTYFLLYVLLLIINFYSFISSKYSLRIKLYKNTLNRSFDFIYFIFVSVHTKTEVM